MLDKKPLVSGYQIVVIVYSEIYNDGRKPNLFFLRLSKN